MKKRVYTCTVCYRKRRRKDVVQACRKSDPPEMSVAVFLGIVGPGPEKLWVEGLNLHEEL